MNLLFYMLFVFYSISSLIFSDFDLNEIDVFGIIFNTIILGTILFLYRKFISTKNPIFVISISFIVLIRGLLIFMMLKNDTHNAIKNENLLYTASGFLVLWCIFRYIKIQKHRLVK